MSNYGMEGWRRSGPNYSEGHIYTIWGGVCVCVAGLLSVSVMQLASGESGQASEVEYIYIDREMLYSRGLPGMTMSLVLRLDRACFKASLLMMYICVLLRRPASPHASKLEDRSTLYDRGTIGQVANSHASHPNCACNLDYRPKQYSNTRPCTGHPKPYIYLH